MRRFVIAAALTVLLTGCGAATTGDEGGGASPDGQSPAQAFLAEHDLAGKGARAVIDELDRLGGSERPDDFMASVRPDRLVLSDEDDEVALPMPEDRFYVSVAPYVRDTHECFHHSLTTCQGELTGEPVEVTITEADGDVLVDERLTTFANGFVGFWLPRDVDATIEVTHGGRTGTADLTTRGDSATCLTTLKLA